MLPFQKIITLIIRTMAKPMLTMAKKKHQQKKFTYFNGFFILVGRKYHRIQHWINWKIVKSAKQKVVKQLKQQVALQKGIQGLYQIFFYCIVIGLPLYQMYKASLSSQAKQQKLNNQISGLQKNLDQIANKLDELMPKRIHKPIIKNPITFYSLNQENKKQQIQKEKKNEKKLQLPKPSQQNAQNNTQNNSLNKVEKKQEKKQKEEKFNVMPSARQLVAETLSDQVQGQIQDSLLQIVSDLIQEAIQQAL